MTAALLGAVSCLRCGDRRSGRGFCVGCGAPWAGADTGGSGHDVGLSGVVRANVGSRLAAYLIDVAVVALPVGFALALVSATSSHPIGSWSLPAESALFTVAVVILVVQLGVLLVRGRSLGRLLLRLRTVDDLSGTPIRPARLLGQIGRGLRPLTADLRRGRDPFEPRLTPAVLGPGATTAWTDSGFAAVPAGESGAGSEAGTGAGSDAGTSGWTGGRAGTESGKPTVGASHSVPVGFYRSVGIVLDSGERYELHRPLVIGRNPVDPDGRSDRALLSWADMSRKLAKTHLLLERSGAVLSVTDLHSAAGTAIIGTDGVRRSLPAGDPTIVPIGALIQCGGRTIKVVPSG